MGAEDEKREAARAGALMVEPGMTVGLGTGSTVAHLLTQLAARDVRALFVATSPRTEHAARALGLRVEPFENLERLDLAIDGADQITRDGWLIKGGGGAHTREKIVAASADRFVVIADSRKIVEELSPPVPLEVLSFGVAATLRQLGSTTLRVAAPSPDGGLIADYWGDVSAPEHLCGFLAGVAGVVEHGLFPPSLVDDILVGRKNCVEALTIGENP